jgi:FMN phosphatase YigB (HAD superfamily)
MMICPQWRWREIILLIWEHAGRSESEQVTARSGRDFAALAAMADSEQQSPVLALVSDFGEFPATPEQSTCQRARIRRDIDDLGIKEFFTPTRDRVTLSVQVGAFKPDRRSLRQPCEAIDLALTLQDALFITERKSHVSQLRGRWGCKPFTSRVRRGHRGY